MASLNVIERINEARRIIAEIDFSKSGTVKGGQSYNFIPISQILDAVRKAQAKAGVTVVFGSPEYDAEQFEKRYSYQKKGAYGETTWHAANGHIRVTIYGGSVDDCIETMVPFEAQDNSDKLTNKIITNAERSLYRTLYAIDEGDGTDPEAFNYEMDAPAPKARAQASEDPFFSKKKPKAEKSVEEIVTNVHRDAIVKWWGKHAFDLPAWFTEIIEDFGTPDKWDDATVTSAFAKLIEAGLIPEAKE